MRRYHKIPGWLKLLRWIGYLISIVIAILVAWACAVVLLTYGGPS